MADGEVISRKQLEDASLDADDLGVVVNGGPTATTVNRAGNELPSIEKFYADATQEIMGALGAKTYLTYDEMVADTTQPNRTPANVTNDQDAAKNGYYVWDESTSSPEWVRSSVQPATREEVDSLRVAIDAQVDMLSEQIFVDGAVLFGRETVATSGTAASSNFTRLEPGGFSAAGVLSEIKIAAEAAGEMKLFIAKPGTAGYDMLESFTVFVTAGVNTFNAGEDFPYVNTGRGWTFGNYQGTALVSSQSGVTNGVLFYSGEAAGEGVAFSFGSTQMRWSATILTGSVKEKIGSLEAESDVQAEQIAELDDVVLDPPIILGRPTPGAGNTTASSGVTRIEPGGFDGDGDLDEIVLWGRAAGTADVKILKPGTSGWDVVSSTSVSILIGENVFKAGGGVLPATDIGEGWTFGAHSATAILAGQSGVSGGCLAFTGNATGTGVTFTEASTQMQWRGTVKPRGNLRVDVEALSDEVAAIQGGTVVTTGPEPLATGTWLNKTNTRMPLSDNPVDADIRAIRVWVDAAGPVRAKIFKRNPSGNMDFVEQRTLISSGPGLATWTKGKDFKQLTLPAGGGIAFYSASVAIAYSTGGSGSSLFASGDVTGSNVSFSNASSIMQVALDLSYQLPEPVRGSRLIDERFQTLDNVVQTGWDLVDGGVQSPDGGNSILYYPEYTVLDPSVISTRVVLTSSSDVLAIARKPVGTTEQFGTMAVFDRTAETLSVAPWDGSTPGVAVKSVSLSALDFSDGAEFSLELRHIGGKNIVKLHDPVTRTTHTVEAEQGVDSNTGRCWGYPCLVAISGDFIARYLAFDILTAPDLAQVGDSETEGFNQGADWNKRVANLYAEETGKSIYLSAHGGSSTRDILRRMLLDIVRLRPKSVIVMAGTAMRGTSSNVAVAIGDLRQFFNVCRSIGARMYIETLPPTGLSTDQNFIQPFNGFILARGFGADVDVIDVELATCLGGDRATADLTLFLSDEYHLNPAGNARRYGQWKVDAQPLFY